MGITWNKEAIERMIAALLAAHPDLNPDYRAMAVFFGQGASYDSMQGRFREYRRLAGNMRGNTDGPVSSTPSRRNRNPTTPRSFRSRVTKSTPVSSSSKGKQSIHRSMDSFNATPTKKESIIKTETTMPETILLDDDDDDDDELQFLREGNNDNVSRALSFGNRSNDVGGANVKSEPVARMVEEPVGSIKQEKRVDSRVNGYVARNDGITSGPSSWPESIEGGVQPRAGYSGTWANYEDFDDTA